MTIATDFEVQNDKDIRYIGAAHGAAGAGYYSGIELHRWLQDLADDAAAAGDDFMDITRDTPSERVTDNYIILLNGFNIDAAASEHLYDASIVQAAGAEIYDSLRVLANAGMDLQVQQNGAIVESDFWNTIPDGSSLKGLNSDSANGISHRFLLLVRTAGADIDGRRLIGQTRVWGKSHSEFRINGTARGNNVLALTYSDDSNNTTLEATVAGWNTISNTEGFRAIDVDNNGTPENYYSEWNRDTYSINQFYERMKYLSRQGTAETIYGLNGEVFRGITHEITVDTPSTTDFSAVEAVSWAAGTGQMLAINDVNNPTKMWIQLLTGVAPTDGQVITGATSTATCAVNVTVTERDVPAKGSLPICGQSTGTSLSGAYGFGIEKLDLGASDKVLDLTNASRQAPNYVTFTVGNLVAGDSVLVANNDTGAIDLNQMALNGALSGAAVTAVVVSGAIPADTPATGTIRIKRASGRYTRHAYTSWTGSTFTIGSTNFSTDNASNGADVFVSYIDGVSAGATMSFTSIYSADRSLFIRVRNGGGTPKIKTSDSIGSLGSAGGSVNASRISDE